MPGPVVVPENGNTAEEQRESGEAEKESVDIIHENMGFRADAVQESEAGCEEPAHPESQAEGMEKDASEGQETPREKEHLVGRFSNGKID